jgi:hypothetical protein
MSNGFRCRAATRKCHSSHETAARIDATKHAIHQPDAHQVALDRAPERRDASKAFPEITCSAQCALQHRPVAARSRLRGGDEPGVARDESRGGNRLVAVTERSTIASETVALTFDTSETAVTALRAV